MTANERTLWEQAVLVLRQNTVTTTVAVGAPKAEHATAKAHKQTGSRQALRS